jgi:hypothetical protein
VYAALVRLSPAQPRSCGQLCVAFYILLRKAAVLSCDTRANLTRCGVVDDAIRDDSPRSYLAALPIGRMTEIMGCFGRSLKRAGFTPASPGSDAFRGLATAGAPDLWHNVKALPDDMNERYRDIPGLLYQLYWPFGAIQEWKLDKD